MAKENGRRGSMHTTSTDVSEVPERRGHITLNHPWFLLLGVISVLAGAGCLAYGGMRPVVLRLSTEVHAYELLENAVIDHGRAKEVLGQQGIEFRPEASKANGIGAFVARGRDVDSVGRVLAVSCVSQVAVGCFLVAASFRRVGGLRS